MLNAIRVAANNWLGRAVLTIIMGFLIVSFAIWGIGDIFKGGVNRTVATVGSAKISAEEFRSSLNNELRRIQMQVRRPVTMEEARAFGLDRELLNRKIDEAALSQKAQSLGLALDAPVVLSSIMDAPEFKTAGQFDRAKLAEALSQAGMNDKEFVRVQEQHLMRLELFNGLLGGMNAPRPLLEALHEYRAGARDVEVIFLDPAKAPAPVAPDDAAMKSFYEAHKSEFRTVETRKASVLALSRTQVAGALALTEDDLKAFHAAGVLTGRFGTPERRTLDRVLFDAESEAKAAAEKISAGGTFEALLADRKINAADVAFGARAKAEISDPAQRDAIFASVEGKVVGPFKDTFGFVLYRVGKIEPGKVTPFESVKTAIEAEARAEKIARDPAIQAKFDAATKTIEDQRIAGKSLAEAAKAAGVAVTTLAALDREGGNGAGSKLEVPGGADTVAAIFTSDIGLDNEPLTLKDGSHIWYEVNAVEPARDRPFEDMKAEVSRRLDAAARDKALLEQATGIIKQIEGGATLASAAQALGLKPEAIKGIKRGQREAKLGGSGVDRAFSGPVGKAVTALAADGAQRAIIVPTKAELPAFDLAAIERSGVTRQAAPGLADDMMSQYTSALRKELGVSINQGVLNQALGQAN
jgi:peptidyl-prolyl cis-trans isomerase D